MTLEKIGPYILGCLCLALVLWALPTPATSVQVNSQSGPTDAGQSSFSARGASGANRLQSSSSSGFSRPSIPRSTSSRRQIDDSNRPPSRSADDGDRPESRNLARLESGEWEEREADTAAGPNEPSQSRGGRGAEAAAQGRPAGPFAGDLSGSGLLGELEELERGYQSAENLLFGGGFGGGGSGGIAQNPFNQDNSDNSQDPGTDPPTDNGDPGDTGDPGDGDTGGGGGNENPDPGAGDPGDSNPPDTTPPERIFDFLVVGARGLDGQLVSRASFDGSQFILEDQSTFGFFPGSFHSLLSFAADSILVIEDTNGDGREDFLRAREIPSLGTSLELFEQSPGGAFNLAAATILYLERVHSVALFDIDGDSELELLVARDGEKRLVVFERKNRDWDYKEEFVLPIEPGLMLVSNESVGGTGYGKLLHIIDSKLQLVLNARAAKPVAFYFGLGTPLQRLQSLQLDFEHRGGNPDRVRMIQMADRLILFDERAGELLAFASVTLGSAPPFLIIGDYTGTGRREMIWLP